MTDLSSFLGRVAAFVDRWYAEPLRATDGCSIDELARAEASIGEPLPEVLRVWLGAVGHRLHQVQDRPVDLDRIVERIRAGAGEIAIWDENQCCWQITVPRGSSGDPEIDVGEGVDDGAHASDALFGMLISDTLVGAWCGHGSGPLGALRDVVVGGCKENTDDALDDRVLDALPELPIYRNPYFEERLRGDDRLIVRGGSGAWEWMAAGEEAFGRASQLLDLDPPGGRKELVFAFADLDDRDRAPTDSQSMMTALGAWIGDAGHVGKAWASGGRLDLFAQTSDPALCVERALAQLTGSARAKLVCAERPEAIARFRAIHPPARRGERILLRDPTL